MAATAVEAAPISVERGERGLLYVYGSDRATRYRVEYYGPSYRRCGCPGWNYRRRCRHVDLVNQLLDRGVRGAPYDGVPSDA